jgi:hypothetical protein
MVQKSSETIPRRRQPFASFESTVFTYGIEITPKQLCLPCFNTFFQPGLYAIRNNH